MIEIDVKLGSEHNNTHVVWLASHVYIVCAHFKNKMFENLK